MVNQANLDSKLIFPSQWFIIEVPIINHPSQKHLLESKKYNMRLACERLNSLIIPKNGVFSFWHLIGKPSARSGFLEGPTFEYGQIVSTYGGGLCQISGLLYNLALHSGIKILERHPHSIDAYGDKRYLPLGRDATVSYFTKDLCFKNDSGTNLQVLLTLHEDKVIGEIRAMEQCPYTVEITTINDSDYIENGVQFKKAKIIRKVKNSSEDFGWDKYRVP